VETVAADGLDHVALDDLPVNDRVAAALEPASIRTMLLTMVWLPCRANVKGKI
jgi:hypothetical protein